MRRSHRSQGPVRTPLEQIHPLRCRRTSDHCDIHAQQIANMLTRRRAQVNAWNDGLLAAAELPHEVHMHILSAIISSTSSLPQLDKLRLVCKSWNANISLSEVFLGMLRAEKLCALERKAWGKTRSMSPDKKRLPASFTLPFLSSDHQIVSVPFRINRSYKRASLFVVEADRSHATAQQVVSLLQTMCDLEGSVCVMLFMIQLPSSSPEDWLDQIKAGAAGAQPVATECRQRSMALSPHDQHTCCHTQACSTADQQL